MVEHDDPVVEVRLTQARKVRGQKHPGMTNADFEELGRYIRHVANEMGLRDWLLNLKYEPPLKDDGSEHVEAGASCQPIQGKRVANLFFSVNFRHEPRDRQRVWVVHELLHCHFDIIDCLTSDDLHTHLGEIYWRAWHPGFKMAIEHVVNAIAEEWAAHMPYIDWPTAKAKKKKSARKRK